MKYIEVKTKLFVLLSLVSLSSQADNYYISISAGYKFNEADSFEYNGSKVDADYGHWMSNTFEMGKITKLYKDRFIAVYQSIGYHHSSQLLSGAPFNKDNEYYKDELFYKLTVTWK